MRRSLSLRLPLRLPTLIPAAALLLAMAHGASHAADPAAFPNKPVHIVVPVAAGGSADKLTRILGERLSTLWGQTVVVENVTGASGTIGAARVAKAAPDGYTLLQQGEGLTLNAILFPDLSYDGQKAFAPVIKAVVNPQILVVNPRTGINTFADYLARAKAKPDSISLALPGNGGIAHVAHEIISQETGAKVNYIPYSGGGPATLDVLGGHADATLITLAAVTEYVRAGKLRALAVTTGYRSPALPDVPTMAEAGYPQYAVSVWYGVAAQSKLPDEIAQKLKASLDRALSDDTFRASLDKSGFAPLPPKSFVDIEKFIDADRKLWAGVIKELNISLD